VAAMTAQDFCYWLQGYFEVCRPQMVTTEELQIIQDHLKLVFAATGAKQESRDLAKLLGTPIRDLSQVKIC